MNIPELELDTLRAWIATHPVAAITAGFVTGLVAGAGLIPTPRALADLKPARRAWLIVGPMMRKELRSTLHDAAAAIAEEALKSVSGDTLTDVEDGTPGS